MFQSPLGEVVKETQENEINLKNELWVSIPSRGSGKGDPNTDAGVIMDKVKEVSIPSRGSGKGDPIYFHLVKSLIQKKFQSPLGEVVKETLRPGSLTQKGFQASNRRTIFYLSIRP